MTPETHLEQRASTIKVAGLFRSIVELQIYFTAESYFVHKVNRKQVII